MLLKRFFDEALAQASYLVGSETTGEAIVIDPNRDIDQYLGAAAAEHLHITHVTETHIHADFLSGARALARRAGASLLLSAEGGSDWQYAFAGEDSATLLRDGDSFRVGYVKVDVLHTPGHTPEHLSFLVTDTATANRPMGVFTGDFLFVGDVGRPDLLERAAHVAGAMDKSARALFHSLRRLRDLPEFLQVWPGHGAGSACGKALGAVPASTLGYERLFNWALSIENKDEFVRAVLAGQPEVPRYFARMKQLNRDYQPVDAAHASAPAQRLDAANLERMLQATSPALTVVDARSSAEFGRGFVPGTINIPGGRSFTNWAGSLLPYDRDLALIVGRGGAEKAAWLTRHLSLIGLDRVTAWGGAEVLDEWRASGRELSKMMLIDAPSLAARHDLVLLDVRSDAEWSEGHIPGSVHHFLGALPETSERLGRDAAVVVSCQGGTRSSIAASLLRRRGFTNVTNFSGGFDEWLRAGLPVEAGQGKATKR